MRKIIKNLVEVVFISALIMLAVVIAYLLFVVGYYWFELVIVPWFYGV